MSAFSAPGCELDLGVYDIQCSHWSSHSGPDLMRLVKKGNGKRRTLKHHFLAFGEHLCIGLCWLALLLQRHLKELLCVIPGQTASTVKMCIACGLSYWDINVAFQFHQTHFLGLLA